MRSSRQHKRGNRSRLSTPRVGPASPNGDGSKETQAIFEALAQLIESLGTGAGGGAKPPTVETIRLTGSSGGEQIFPWGLATDVILRSINSTGQFRLSQVSTLTLASLDTVTGFNPLGQLYLPNAGWYPNIDLLLRAGQWYFDCATSVKLQIFYSPLVDVATS